ncbi:MAG: hypothetical protein ACI381_04600 [Candidatus Methanomethylophilaceae archaeon]
MTTEINQRYNPCKRISDQISTISTQIQVQREAFKRLPRPIDSDREVAIQKLEALERSGLDMIVAAAEMVSAAREERRRLSL